MKKHIHINSSDGVIVALEKLKKGSVIEEFDVVLPNDVPSGHKIAVKDIPKGEDVIKYGSAIGIATADIKKGDTVHTHNLATKLSEKAKYRYTPSLSGTVATPTRSFMGYKRKDGRVGIRNEIWIIPTVGCVNSVALAIADQAKSMVRGSVCDVIAYTHPYGCSQMGDDQENTKKVLAKLANHPNAGGVLLLGLGCENCGIDSIKAHLGDYDEQKIKFLIAQEVEDEIEAALSIVDSLIESAATNRKERVSLAHLTVGLKCGGSDGLSGITANPAVGVFSDLLIKEGGTTILTEVPEMFGAEQLLMNRCVSREIYDKTVKLIDDFKEYFTRHNQVVYENPSPGNKEGGISTLEDKSLGCTQKSGTADVVDVLEYAQSVKKSGLNLLAAPGNDLVAATALAVSGAQLVLFTTGRGTPFASPVPTVKISSNTPLFEKKSNWIDFNTGIGADGVTISEIGEKLFEKVLDIANGEQVKSEINSYHDMAIFKQGVTL